MLNGKFRGEIVSTDTLIIGEKGVVHANVHCRMTHGEQSETKSLPAAVPSPARDLSVLPFKR